MWEVAFPSLSAPFPSALVPTALTMEGRSSFSSEGGVGIHALHVTQGAAFDAAAASEVQVLDCQLDPGALHVTAGMPASATFVLSFVPPFAAAGGGMGPSGVATAAATAASATPSLPATAANGAALLAAALAALPGVPNVRVAVYGRGDPSFLDGAAAASAAATASAGGGGGGGAPPLCSLLGSSTAITFTHNPGPMPPLRLILPPDFPGRMVVRVAPAVGAWGGRAVRGTRDTLPCSGRGTCDSSGACVCPSDRVGRPVWGPSDGGGGAGEAGWGGWANPAYFGGYHPPPGAANATVTSPSSPSSSSSSSSSSSRAVIGGGDGSTLPFPLSPPFAGLPPLPSLRAALPMPGMEGVFPTFYRPVLLPHSAATTLLTGSAPSADFGSATKVLANCGRLNPAASPTGLTPTHCTNDCRAVDGNGACSGPPYFTCACKGGFGFPDCTAATCTLPKGSLPDASVWTPPKRASLTLSPSASSASSPSSASLSLSLSSTIAAHYPTPCGGMGVCVNGGCSCSAGWTGLGCSVGACPGGGGMAVGGGVGYNATCSGGGACVTLRQLTQGWSVAGGVIGDRLFTAAPAAAASAAAAASSSAAAATAAPLPSSPAFVYASPWDANVFRGCVCKNEAPLAFSPGSLSGGGWARGTGLGCLERSCPSGPDPLATIGGGATGAPPPAPPTSSQRLICTLDSSVGGWNASGRFFRPGALPSYSAIEGGSFFLSLEGSEAPRPISPGASVFDRDVWSPLWTLDGGSLESALYMIKTLPGFRLTVERWEGGSGAAGGGAWVDAVVGGGGTQQSTPILLTDSIGAERQAHSLATLCHKDGTVAVRIDILGRALAPPPLLRVRVARAEDEGKVRVERVGGGGGATASAAGDASSAVSTAGAAVQQQQQPQAFECSRRGVCNRVRGNCSCAPYFLSSNGLGGQGALGDCGFHANFIPTDGGASGGQAAPPGARKKAAGVFK